MEMLTIFLRHDESEKEAWGGYRTEFYPTYDYRALYEVEKAKQQ